MTTDNEATGTATTEPVTEATLVLDGITFVGDRYGGETAWRDGVVVGAVDYDDEMLTWLAGVGPAGAMDMRRMRCRAEARAFVVTQVRALDREREQKRLKGR